MMLQSNSLELLNHLRAKFPVYEIIYRHEYNPDIDSIEKAFYKTEDKT